MSIRVTLSCQVKPGVSESFKIFLNDNLANVRSFAGCVNVSVLFNEQESEMMLDESWLGQSEHQAYMASIEQSGVLASLAEFLAGPPEIKYWQVSEL